MKSEGFPYHLVDQWLKTFAGVRVLCPFTTSREEMTKITDFRRRQNLESAPYLEEEFQRDIEERFQIDQRSMHFAIESKGSIVACVRATPPPYELSALNDDLGAHAKSFSNFYEFGRLCTDSSLELRGRYARMLVVKAAQVLFQNDYAGGIVGICRSDRLLYMKRLGLETQEHSVRLDQRDGSYHLIHATKERLLSYHFAHLFVPFIKSSQIVPEAQPQSLNQESAQPEVRNSPLIEKLRENIL